MVKEYPYGGSNATQWIPADPETSKKKKMMTMMMLKKDKNKTEVVHECGTRSLWL